MAYLSRSPKFRGWLKIIWHSRKIRRKTITTAIVLLTIALIYIFHPTTPEKKLESRPIFEGYAQTIILGLQAQDAISIDTNCFLSDPKPELAYTLPTIINIFKSIVEKPNIPRLVQLDDTLKISFDGYKHFDNRKIKITRAIKRKLGPRYPLQISSYGKNHELVITYIGKPWDNEQLCGLPVFEASLHEQVDPALLMSIIRHTSDFDFNYISGNNDKGILALDTGYGLEQIFIGAHKLKQALQSTKTTEDAVAALYPLHDLKGMNSEWRKSTLKSSWVKEVLNDVQFYKNNGLKPVSTP